MVRIFKLRFVINCIMFEEVDNDAYQNKFITKFTFSASITDGKKDTKTVNWRVNDVASLMGVESVVKWHW